MIGPALLLLLAAAPATPPGWSARTVPKAKAVAAATVRVKPGETLGLIAARTGSGEGAIALANHLAPRDRLRPGQRLTIPAGRYHLVRAGEAGIAVARAYGVPWARIVAANGLAEPYLLRAGQRLLIPKPPPPATLEARAAAFHLDIDDILTGGEPALGKRDRPAPPVRSAGRTLSPQAAVAPPPGAPGRFAWPLDGEVATFFGPLPDGRRSDGIEIAAKRGAAVRAAADGVVAYAGRAIPAYGGLVLIKHGGGWITAYGRAATLLVKRGQAVKRGQTIARIGGSGDPQLMFQLRHDRVAVDPLARLPAGDGPAL